MTIISEASTPLHQIKKEPKPASLIFLNFTDANTVDQRQIINQGLHCPNCYSQKVVQLIRNSNICDGLSFFNPKGFYCSYAWFCSSHEGRTPFCTTLISKKLHRFLLMFLTCFNSLSVLLLFPLPITLLVFMHGFWFHFICLWQSCTFGFVSIFWS